VTVITETRWSGRNPKLSYY